MKNKNSKNSPKVPVRSKAPLKNSQKDAAKTVPVKEQPFYKTKKGIITIAIASLLVLALIGGVVAAIIITYQNEHFVDYLNEDLSRYIIIKEEDYKGYELKIAVPKPNDKDLQHKIITVLNKYVTKDDILDGGNYFTATDYPDKAIGVGDRLQIRYNGYSYDEDGNRVSYAGTSNFADSSPYELTVGSGVFVTGFELGLVGKKLSEHSVFEKFEMGDVRDGDVVYATATYVEEAGGFYEDAQIRIDLRDENVEKIWGIGIKDALQARGIGLINGSEFTLSREGTDEKITYVNMRVDYVTRCENNPIVVEATFPYNYTQSAELRNKTIYFDVYVERGTDYKAPEWNDTFVTEKLELTESDLSEYEGESLTAKCEAMYMSELMAEYEKNCLSVAEEEMWAHLKEAARIKRLPRAEVRSVFDNYYYTLEAQYTASYANYYDSLELFLTDYLGLAEGADWSAYITEIAEDEITEKLIFYSIARAENLIPTGAELDKVYKEALESDYNKSTGKSREDFSTDEEYDSQILAFKAQMLSIYGEAGYLDTVYYNYAIGKIVMMADIKNEK